MGLRDGDVVSAVNGQDLNNAARTILLTSLIPRDQSSISVTVMLFWSEPVRMQAPPFTILARSRVRNERGLTPAAVMRWWQQRIIVARGGAARSHITLWRQDDLQIPGSAPSLSHTRRAAAKPQRTWPGVQRRGGVRDDRCRRRFNLISGSTGQAKLPVVRLKSQRWSGHDKVMAFTAGLLRFDFRK